MIRTLVLLLALLLSLLLSLLHGVPAEAGSPADNVIIVDTGQRELRVLRGDEVLAVFNPVSTGRWGASTRKHLGDGKTPLGSFRIAWKKTDGQFGPFLGIDYPSVERAKSGLAADEITSVEYAAIVRAHERGRAPPQNTRLGGHIGIHGLGRADPEIHLAVDWTQGCIAVTNDEMTRLLRWADVGTPVIIR